MKLLFLSAILFLIAGLAIAQTAVPQTPGRENVFNNHLWVTYLGDHKVAERWSLHTEGHWRRAELGKTWQQLLLRPAVNFHLNPDLVFTAGYSFYKNYPYEEGAFRFVFNEHHAWEQVQLGHGWGRLKLSHRYRLEQRFIETFGRNLPDSVRGPKRSRYLNRFRYRLGATVPITGEKMEKNTLFASAYDEVFLTFGDDSRIDAIQQNRISALLGWQFDDKGSSLQLGFLYQSIMFPRTPIVNSTGTSGLTDDLIENNRTIHLIFTWNLDFRRREGFVPWLPRGERKIKVKPGPSK